MCLCNVCVLCCCVVAFGLGCFCFVVVVCLPWVCCCSVQLHTTLSNNVTSQRFCGRTLESHYMQRIGRTLETIEGKRGGAGGGRRRRSERKMSRRGAGGAAKEQEEGGQEKGEAGKG